MTTNIYKKRINNTFLKTLFVDTNYRNVKMGPLMSRQLTTKTTRDDITTLITSAYNKITIPYKYDNIKHLSYLLKILYSKINNLIISDLNDYEEVLLKTYQYPFNINVDFEKLYNALYYCLLTTNTNIYKIKKKSFGKKAYYFVYKIFKDDTELFVLISINILDDTNFKYKFNIDVFRSPATYEDVKKVRKYHQTKDIVLRDSNTSAKTRSH
jgi:hypothetical protein